MVLTNALVSKCSSANLFSFYPVLRFEKHTLLMKPDQDWEELKIGSAPPPIRTEHGWILIYHGVDKDLVYRAGAALLDLDNPFFISCHILCRKYIHIKLKKRIWWRRSNLRLVSFSSFPRSCTSRITPKTEYLICDMM
jgi:hypothetical protein